MKKEPTKKPRSTSHAVLGRLTYEDAYGWWKCRSVLPSGCEVDFYVSVEGIHDLSTRKLFDRGAEFLAWAQQSEPAILKSVADVLLQTYRDNWVSEPRPGEKPMSRKMFLSHVTSQSINLHADGSAFWYLADGGLFAGHCIEVRIHSDRSISEVGLAG